MDIVIIGGGPAGRTAALEASSLGENVKVIEDNKVGGTCLNEGCMVVCGLNDVCKFILDSKNFQNLGIADKSPEISFHKVIEGIKNTTAKISHILESETREAGAEIVMGKAKLEDDGVSVNGQEFNYDKLIIATGARPFIPDIEGTENALTYRDILNLKELPQKMNIIGSGVISAEFANIFSIMGAEVDVFCRNQFLRMLDDDIKKYVVDNLLTEVTIHENVQTKGIYDDYLLTENGKIEGRTLFATGLVPNSEIATDVLELNETSHINVDKTMRTSNENIYAAGDVARMIGNTPISRAEGVIAARNACGIYSEMDYNLIPYAINLYYDVAYLNSGSDDNGVDGYIPGSAGPGSFWRALAGMTGITKLNVNENRGVNKIFSISPSSRTSMAYISKLLREGQKIDDFDDFMEVHPSTDAIYKLMRFLARFE